MRDDPDKSYALECLKLATVQSDFSCSAEDTLQIASKFLAFVLVGNAEGDKQTAAALIEALK